MDLQTDKIILTISRATRYGLMAGTIVAIAAITLPSARAKVARALAAAPGYAVGERINLPSETYSASQVTVLVFARSSCPACKTALPFLQRLVRELRTVRDARVLLISTTERTESELEFAEGLGMAPSQVLTFDAKSDPGIRLALVPAVVVVDRRGRIHGVMEGLPRPLAWAAFENLLDTSRKIR